MTLQSNTRKRKEGRKTFLPSEKIKEKEGKKKMKIDFFGIYEQAENMIKTFDKWAIYYYNVFGCKRVDSFYNRETKNHYIRIAIPDYIYNFIRSGFLSELSEKFQKDIEILNDMENEEKRISIMVIN